MQDQDNMLAVKQIFGNQSEWQFFQFCSEEIMSYHTKNKLFRMVTAPDWNPSGWKNKSYKSMEQEVIELAGGCNTFVVDLHEGTKL